jgi:hypothetical protein
MGRLVMPEPMEQTVVEHPNDALRKIGGLIEALSYKDMMQFAKIAGNYFPRADAAAETLSEIAEHLLKATK